LNFRENLNKLCIFFVFHNGPKALSNGPLAETQREREMSMQQQPPLSSEERQLLLSMESEGFRFQWVHGFNRYMAMHPRTGTLYYLSGSNRCVLSLATFNRDATSPPSLYMFTHRSALEPWERQTLVEIPEDERVLPDRASDFPSEGLMTPNSPLYGQSIVWRRYAAMRRHVQTQTYVGSVVGMPAAVTQRGLGQQQPTAQSTLQAPHVRNLGAYPSVLLQQEPVDAQFRIDQLTGLLRGSPGSSASQVQSAQYNPTPSEISSFVRAMPPPPSIDLPATSNQSFSQWSPATTPFQTPMSSLMSNFAVPSVPATTSVDPSASAGASDPEGASAIPPSAPPVPPAPSPFLIPGLPAPRSAPPPPHMSHQAPITSTTTSALFSTQTSVVASSTPVISFQQTADVRHRFGSVVDLQAAIVEEMMPERQRAEFQRFQSSIQPRAGPSAGPGLTSE